MKFGNIEIGGMSFGSTRIGGMNLGSTPVFRTGSGPSPAVMIPYIRNSGDAYIDTGITPDETTKIVVWARNVNPGAKWIFGSRIANNNASLGIWAGLSGNSGDLQYSFGTNTLLKDKFTLMSNYNKYELSGEGFKVNDQLVGAVSATTFSNSYNILLFGINTGGSYQVEEHVPIDICACKIYKGGVLVRDYTPVGSPSVGLHDAVSDTVFTNAGNGSLAYGSFNLNAYTPLEYISSSGSSWFDSGVYGKYSERIVFKFRPTNTTAKWTSAFGYRTSTNCCDVSFGTATSGQDNARCYWRFGTNDTAVNPYNNTSNRLTGKDIIAVKSDAIMTLYSNDASIGTATKTGVNQSFVTAGTMGVGSLKTGESSFSYEGFIGRIYHSSFGAAANFVPAKNGNKVGMYDTYNDVFKESETATPFVAGPEL